MNTVAVDICPKCNQAIEPGVIVVGASWNGEGGEHLECPEQPITLETNEEERQRLATALTASLATLGVGDA